MHFQNGLLKIVSVTLALLGFEAQLYAGSAEYDAAIAKADYTEASEHTAEIWQNLDQTSEDAATIVRDLAFTNYKAENFESAQLFANELLKNNSPLEAHDSGAYLNPVLSSLIQFSIKDSRKNRNALLKSLEQRLSIETTDPISTQAAKALLINDWDEQRFLAIRDSSSIAMELFDRMGESGLAEKFNAEFLAVLSDFYRRQKSSSYDQMLELHNAIFESAISTGNPDIISSLASLKWQTFAWTGAMRAFSLSYLKNDPEKGVNLRNYGYELFIEDTDAYAYDRRPLCGIDQNSFQTNTIKFPASAAFKKMIGSVVTKVDINADGSLTNPRVLAAIPAEHFAEAVLDALPNMQVKAQQQNNCRLERSNFVYTITFLIQ